MKEGGAMDMVSQSPPNEIAGVIKHGFFGANNQEIHLDAVMDEMRRLSEELSLLRTAVEKNVEPPQGDNAGVDESHARIVSAAKAFRESICEYAHGKGPFALWPGTFLLDAFIAGAKYARERT